MAESGPSKELVIRAENWGEAVARKFAKAITESGIGERESNLEMLSHRRMLLLFAASIGFETLADDTLGGLAQKKFLDTVGNFNT